ncbi:class I SAM-dependent methyltransferase [Microlunatus flavus]|uniref:Nodulation protein S (NodS) n=1 Tax=Microlunatus flavus TaxID=1036181 RepID=A0A1H9C9P7_9ACTN|nr:class I SAM-dependent methyltransferase [Microlunatus flavus]SEP97896.1 Nodulation protein S (NodS) [Microlunatus flavus]
MADLVATRVSPREKITWAARRGGRRRGAGIIRIADPDRASGPTGGPPDFDALYRADPDPWEVGTSAYERRKRAVVLACLRRDRYTLAWDPACGTGHLTADLASRCDQVHAADASAEAVRLTAERCADLPVTVRHRALPAAPDPGSRPDLVVVSEVFYYLSDAQRAATVALVDERAARACEVVAVHWDGAPDDAWLSGPAGQLELVSRLAERGWVHRIHHDDDGFLLDTLTRGPA